MGTRFHQVLYNLRSLPVGARHALLWGGSFLIFLVVFFLWIGQVKSHLQSIFPIKQYATAPFSQESQATELTSENSSPIEKGLFRSSPENRLTQILELLKKGGAGLLSLLKPDKESGETRYKEGQELNDFLQYQTEFYQEFPQHQ